MRKSSRNITDTVFREGLAGVMSTTPRIMAQKSLTTRFTGNMMFDELAVSTIYQDVRLITMNFNGFSSYDSNGNPIFRVC